MTTTTKQPALEALFESSETTEAYVGGFIERMAEVTKTVDVKKVAQVIGVIKKACEESRSIFFIANGGSAAVASHIVNDLCPNSLVEDRPGFRAYSLVDNVESVTAIANDSGFENIFLYQLRCDLRPGDVLVALSVSGNSENIIRAVDYANEIGATTIGWSGFEDGGRLAEKAQIAIHIASTRDEYGPVEDIFSNLGHIITGYLTMDRGRKLYH